MLRIIKMLNFCSSPPEWAVDEDFSVVVVIFSVVVVAGGVVFVVVSVGVVV